jgi:hypothetical protein
MQNTVDHYFMTLREPERSCLLFLRSFILGFSENISEQRRNNTPFYYFHGRWLGFISYHPKTHEIYISFANGNRIEYPGLVSEGRKKMKILYIDPSCDIDVKTIGEILKLCTDLLKP